MPRITSEQLFHKLDSLTKEQYSSAINYALGAFEVTCPKEFEQIIIRAIKYAKRIKL